MPNTPCSAKSIADYWFDWLPDLDLEVDPNAPVAVWPMERPSFALPLIMLFTIIPPAESSQPEVETQPKRPKVVFRRRK